MHGVGLIYVFVMSCEWGIEILTPSLRVRLISKMKHDPTPLARRHKPKRHIIVCQQTLQ
jgi:hypothetical protein